jgi:hypothetical protein
MITDVIIQDISANGGQAFEWRLQVRAIQTAVLLWLRSYRVIEAHALCKGPPNS